MRNPRQRGERIRGAHALTRCASWTTHASGLLSTGATVGRGIQPPILPGWMLCEVCKRASIRRASGICDACLSALQFPTEYVPTPGEIERGAAKVRRGWSEEEERRRRATQSPEEVTLPQFRESSRDPLVFTPEEK